MASELQLDEFAFQGKSQQVSPATGSAAEAATSDSPATESIEHTQPDADTGNGYDESENDDSSRQRRMSDTSYNAEEDEEDDDDDDGDNDDGSGAYHDSNESTSDSGSDEPASLRGNKARKSRFARDTVVEEAIANPELFGLRRSGRERRQRRDRLEEMYKQEEAARQAARSTRRKTTAKGRKTRGAGGGGRRRKARSQWTSSDDDDNDDDDDEDDDDDDSDESDSSGDWGARNRRGGGGGRGRQASESDESEESDGWVPGNARPKRSKRTTRRRTKRRGRGGDSDDDDDDDDYSAHIPQRISFRNTGRSVNYRESDTDEGLDEEERLAIRAAQQTEDTRERINLIVVHKQRKDVVQEMRHLLSLEEIIAGEKEAPPGKTLEEIQEDIDSSLVSVLGKSEEDAAQLEQGGDGDDMLYCINWVGRSHIHNTWHTAGELRSMDIAGVKKLDNYRRDVRLREESLNDPKTTTEDREYFNCQLEMHYEALAKHKVVERIVLNRTLGHGQTWDDDDDVEYLCKWFGLDYDCNTWESANLICPRFQSLVDEYLERQNSSTLPTTTTRRKREPFRMIRQQPSWLPDPDLSLRDYQLQGVSWLARSWCDGNSVILADEMGLGKTIQSIVFLSYLFNVQRVYGPFLIVVPLSTIMAWSRELHKWAPAMNTIVYVGNKASREAIRDHEFYNDRGKIKFNVLLTTYEKVNTNLDDLQQIRWAALVVDEAHRLKNHESMLHQALSDLRHDFRLLVTGTPLQNSMKELWALLHFIMPRTFASWEEFEERYGGLGDDAAANHKMLQTLHEDIKPYLIRRVKKDVEKSLPKKVEKILRVGLSQSQKQIYKHIITKNYTALRSLKKGQKSSLVNVIMELKKCCNHASLIDQAPLSNPDVSPTENMRNLLKGSGKLILLDKLLQRLHDKGHRVLIFSQMVLMLDVLATYLMMKGYPFQRLDGNIPNERRKQAIDHFNAPGSADFCFILSTRAGGLGVNLATADTVIIFDSDWNPQNDLQAQARAHRIGQTRQVNIYRFVSKNTVEEDILERAKKKMVLDHLVIQRMDTTGSSVLNLQKKKSGGVEYNKEELDAIIKFGAADLFGEQESSSSGGGGGGDSGDQDLKLDLDTVLEQAETHDTQEAATGMSDELLSAFKTVDIETNEEELDEVARKEAEERAKQEEAEKAKAKALADEIAAKESQAVKSWDEILPEDVRKQAALEEQVEKMKQLYLPPRKRKQPVLYGQDDDDDDDDAGPSSAGRARSKPLKELEEAKVGTFTAEEVRNLVIAVRKFGDYENKAETITAEANMKDRDASEIKRLLDWLFTKCSERRQAMAKETDAAKKKDLRRLSLGKQPINTEEYLFRIEGLTLLHKLIQNAKGPFRVHTKVKMPKWDCEWKPTDDANLLVGVDKYGLGAWDKVKADTSLKLGSLILQEKGKKPQENHLKNRVETLLKELIKTKLRKPLQLTSAGKKRSSTNATPGKKSKQTSVKSFVERIPKKKAAASAGSDDEFQKKQITPKLVTKWMQPVAAHIKTLADEGAEFEDKSGHL
ncbi:chromodomain helicase DNA binding protein 1 [Salpingoeca rosetta]|uniref:Chromodomain helicase DNA binding protein 1 n=1 Tax=Salpingoeca rosetta (strain ATCC 50818 / BSB-021) TaxID=946362 RepID=F2TWF2_SALR5|nr:chromodomain helicase DNA binding protein 1 [Salpingoeca rosetta]EGD72398.1 chromodomain helicase DNA binding protein 1 [Salpingoeca rosetta]|eukprot:XP_004998967.1 chromodomain helicase DNA binding protein 1 [Salpingoeca rosetta]